MHGRLATTTRGRQATKQAAGRKDKAVVAEGRPAVGAADVVAVAVAEIARPEVAAAVDAPAIDRGRARRTCQAGAPDLSLSLLRSDSRCRPGSRRYRGYSA